MQHTAPGRSAQYTATGEAPAASPAPGVPDGTGGAPTVLRLRPPAHRVDPRAVAWWTWQAVLVVLGVLACVAGLLAWLWRMLPLPVSAGAAALSVLLSVAYVTIAPRRRYRVHRWETTDEAVYTWSGWLWQISRIAPMSRIQTVDTARGPLQQMLGLATVVVTTASAAGPVRIHGLDHERAKEVAAHLAATTQATQAADGDAT
ncbi:PH domain-containing protein [Streptomyces sporangiiformans]|uniref:PH domain-containing protein n=2 Tax=Streptomyces sporangiiformans TaxID=2315329 RepID=A0A505DRP4_9ACTN|nr:PH domain-containing protein [Streptomyces sporangiiformans]